MRLLMLYTEQEEQMGLLLLQQNVGDQGKLLLQWMQNGEIILVQCLRMM